MFVIKNSAATRLESVEMLHYVGVNKAHTLNAAAKCYYST